MSQETAPPRRLGLLGEMDAKPPAESAEAFALPVDSRIGGDLVIIGHLAIGRWSQLYQVWSAEEWCAYTCKLLAPEHAGGRRARGALRRERRILRRLHHPNIVRYHGAGEEGRLPYLLVEYLEGPTVLDLLERAPSRRLPVEDAVRIAVQVSAALYHVHRAGHVYLDVKPANLLLKDGQPVLVDFDAARPIEPQRRPREIIGTAPYLAPELALREAPDPRADIYSVGSLLYELVTGRWPFERVFERKERREGLEHDYPQIGDVSPPPPSDFTDAVTASLESIIMRCLARDPSDRWSSLHPLMLALTAELEGPASFWPAGVRAERRRRPRG